MSLLLDSLRRGRQPADARGTPRRTLRADAVLATLGYSPERNAGGRRLLGHAAGGAALLAAGWVGWIWYSGSSAALVPPGSPSAQLHAMPQARPVPPPRKTAPGADVPGLPQPGFPQPPTGPGNASTPGVTGSRAAAPPLHSPSTASASQAPPAPSTPQPPSPVAGAKPSAPPANSKATPQVAAQPPKTPASRPPLRPALAPSSASQPAALSGAAGPASADDFELALYYQRAGDFDNALIHYRALLQRSPMNARARNNLGLLYQTKGMLDEAVAEFQRALYIDSRYLKARNNLGVALLNQGNVDAAAAEFRSVLAQDARNVDALVNLALAEKASGRPEQAKETLLRALLIDRRSAAAHYNLGLLFETTGEAARAIEHYRAFLEHAESGFADRAPEVRARLDALANRGP